MLGSLPISQLVAPGFTGGSGPQDSTSAPAPLDLNSLSSQQLLVLLSADPATRARIIGIGAMSGLPDSSDPRLMGSMSSQIGMQYGLGRPRSTRKPGLPLALPCDEEHLSEYQILVRKQLEIFSADDNDLQAGTQGRKKPVVMGQVGVRCVHCADLPIRQRGRGAIYYPTKLSGIYQAAQNMATTHLAESCHLVPDTVKTELVRLRGRRDLASGGKQYWADGCGAMGIIETPEGMRMKDDPHATTGGTTGGETTQEMPQSKGVK